MSVCLFCKIIEKTVPAKFVSEDKFSLAIEDVSPQAPVHVLVVPKVHVETVMDLKVDHDEVWWAMLEMAQKVAQTKNIIQPGFRLVLNCNPGAGQSVYHVHMHVLGGRPFAWPPG